MSGGGDSTPAPAPSTTTSIQDIPAWEQGYVTNLLGQAQAVAAQPYQQFPGQQVAGFTPDQSQAFSNVENLSSGFNPLNSTGSLLNASAGNLANSTNTASPQGIQSFMSPYTNNVVQGIQNEANENWNQNIMPGVNNEFVGSGQFGSGRNAQVLGQAAGNFQTGLSANVSNALQSGYTTAGQQAATQAGLQQNAGAQLGNLAATQQGVGLENAQALQATGQQQQQQNQTNLNTAQTNWQNQVNYPAQQTEYLNQIIRGLPASAATTSASQTTPLGVYSPSPLTGIGSAGVTGLALSGANGQSLGTATGLKRGGIVKGYATGGQVDDGDPTDPENDDYNNPEDASDPDNALNYAVNDNASTAQPNPIAQLSTRPTASAAPSPSPLDVLDTSESRNNNVNPNTSKLSPMDEGKMQQMQLLALARGLLSPTRTGSALESEGAGIGNVESVMQQQQQFNQQQQQLQYQRDMQAKQFGLEQQKVGLQKEQIEQGKYTPIKDMFGNVTGAIEGKTGKVLPLSAISNGQSGAGASSIYDGLAPGMQREVDGIIAGTIMPPNPSSRAPGAQALLAAAAEKDPSFDAINYAARAKTRQSFTSGQDATNIAAINTAIPHIVKLKQSFDNLGNTDYPAYNAIANAAGNALGNTKTQAHTAAVSTDATAVAHELAKVFRTTGMSEGEINDWQNKISTSAAPASSNQVIQSALDLMDGRLQTLGDKYNQGMGTTKQPLELLSPSSRKAYSQLRGVSSDNGDSQGAAQSSKITTQAKIAQTASERGKSIEQVMKDAQAKGYTIQ